MDSDRIQELRSSENGSAEKSTSEKSTSEKSTSEKSTSEKSTSEKSISEKSISEKSSSEKSSEFYAEVSELPEPTANTDQAGEPSQTDSSETNTTMRCEFKWLERRYNQNSEPFFKEQGKEVWDPQLLADWRKHYPFCIVESFDQNGQSEHTQMHINSEDLCSLLHFVFHDSVDSSDLHICSPYWPLFYNYVQLGQIGHSIFRGKKDSTAYLNLLLDWIRTHFHPEFRACNAFMNDRKIFYDYLWTVFAPKSIVYNMSLGTPRAFRYVDFDGDKIGETGMNLLIPKRDEIHLAALEVKPLDFEENADAIRQSLTVQGKNFEKCISQHHGQYNGMALKKNNKRAYDLLSIHGRIMIDCKTYLRFNTNDSVYIEKPLIYIWSASGEFEPSARLNDDQALITNPTVRGFSFTANRFLEFFVNNIQPVEWSHSFDQLDLGPEVQTTLQGAILHHTVNRSGISYVDSSSRKGLVCLLHGPRGVGKTLTVECAADYVKRPLYIVSSGDLGTTSDDLDRSLNYIMCLASIWKAVLLIDDVDVFLQPRASLDFHHNAMMSTFLRMIDSYEGLLFLTTTRVTAIDWAFMSRIHIPVHYKPTPPQKRLEIWRDSYMAIPGVGDPQEYHLQTLAAQDFNGRQIENIIKAADDLATSGAVPVDTVMLQTVASIHTSFQQDLTREVYRLRHGDKMDE
ncbi:P-loop containing nucleoside triphosphate hydrolase protein [Xylaria curta]|nr:P-loop containing nucleoside triphosphate hydrolase protein [Xylaria curta]